MERKPKLLDLFCKAGAASMGYSRAGYEVEGVDIKPQPHYPFKFYLADALEFPLEGYDAYHASPPCQGYCSHTKDDSQYVHYHQGKQTPRLIVPIRARLKETGKPYVIENVRGAAKELDGQLLLCGTMFGLPISRHRLFDCSFPILGPGHPKCRGVSGKYADKHGLEHRDMSVTGKGRRSGCLQTWMTIMGISWPMRQADIVEAIPPIYTEYIGRNLMAILASTGAL